MPILETRPHPNADKLLLLQVDVGDQQKQIVAGIREHYTPEQLVGKLIRGTAARAVFLVSLPKKLKNMADPAPQEPRRTPWP